MALILLWKKLSGIGYIFNIIMKSSLCNLALKWRYIYLIIVNTIDLLMESEGTNWVSISYHENVSFRVLNI